MSIQAGLAYLDVNGMELLSVLSMQGFEKVSEPFCFEIETHILDIHIGDILLNKTAKLYLKGLTEHQQISIYSGFISEITIKEQTQEHGYLISVVFHSIMAKLKMQYSLRTFVDSSIQSCIKKIFEQHGLNENVVWKTRQIFAVLPMSQQHMDETDLEYINRLSIMAGLHWYSVYDEDLSKEIIVFSDNSSHFSPYIVQDTLQAMPKDSEEAKGVNFSGIDEIKVIDQLLPDTIQLIVTDEGKTETAALQLNHQINTGCVQSAYDLNLLLPEKLDEQCQYASEHLKTHNKLFLKGNAASIKAGHIFYLDSTRMPDGFNELSGTYFIESCEHHIVSRTDKSNSKPIYINRCTVIPAACHYRMPLLNTNIKKATYFVRGYIPSSEKNNSENRAELDEKGLYQVKLLQDVNNKETVYPWMERLQMFGGVDQKTLSPMGFHSPLYPGAEVLVGWLEENDGKPCIVGSFPNTLDKTPVDSSNHMQNKWVTSGDNLLMMDDTEQKANIYLSTPKNKNSIMFDDTFGKEGILLQTKEGNVKLDAKRSICLESKSTIKEVIGTQKLEAAGENLKSEIHGNYHLDVSQNFNLHTYDTLHWQAGERLEWVTQGNWSLMSRNQGEIVVQHQDFTLEVTEGDIVIECGRSFIMQGNGHGSLVCAGNSKTMQNRGGFQIDSQGNLHLFGKNIDMNAHDVNLHGTVTNMVERPQVAHLAEVKAAPDPVLPEPLPILHIQNTDIPIDENQLHYFNEMMKVSPQDPFALQNRNTISEITIAMNYNRSTSHERLVADVYTVPN